MTTIKPIGSNQTLLVTPNQLILFSYATPVAIYDKHTYRYFRTAKKWSKTTSRHINHWLDGVQAVEMPQEFFDNRINMIEGV